MRLWPAIQITLFLTFTAATVAINFGKDALTSTALVHGTLILMLAVMAWFHLSLGTIRESVGLFSAGIFYTSLTLLCASTLNRWLSWPGPSLFCIAVALMAGLVIWKLLPHRRTRVEAVVLCSITAITPVILRDYEVWSVESPDLLSIIATTALAGIAAYIIKHRQRVTITSLATWLVFITLSVTLLLADVVRSIQIPPSNLATVAAGLIALTTIVATNMADTLHVEAQLRRGPHLQLDASLKDPLTGLANRRALELHGPLLLQQSQEASRPVSMIVADIDHFKQVNDTYGHLTGDAVLRTVARRLSETVRKSDLVARYGGEEFVIILPGSPLVPALRLAEKMRNALESGPIQHDGTELKVTSSFGVVTSFPEEPMSLTDMIARADANLYRAKHHGRNCVMADALPSELI